MKTHYEININTNDLFKNESLLQVLNNLEKLEQITEDVFNRINKSLVEKKTKLENLKSRINRASIIISSFETIPQALLIKSKRFYPNTNEDNKNNFEDNFILNQNNSSNSSNNKFFKSIYYDDVCDFNLIRNNPNFNNSNIEINSKPSNQPSKLGKKPDGSLEDVTLSQEILNHQKKFKEVKTDMTINRCAENLFNKSEITSDIKHLNSIFQFTDKHKVFGEKKSNISNEPRESNILNTFMKQKPKPKEIQKKPQDAPVSISDKVKMTQFKQKKDLIRRNTNNNNIQFNIPLNLNLPLISEFVTETTPLEDYFADDRQNEIYAPQGTIYSDDINEYQMPLDLIRNYNNKQQGIENNVKNNNNNNTQMNNNDHSNNLNQNNQNINNNNSNIQQQQVVQQPQNSTTNNNTLNQQQTTQNVPKVQTVSQVSNVPSTNKKIPPMPKGKIPPVPKIKIPPIPKIMTPSVPSVPSVPSIPKVPNLPVQVKNENKTLPPSNLMKRPTSLLDDIASFSRSALKKTSIVEQPKPKMTIQNPANVMDLLKQQIGLRFNNLNKNNKPVKTKKKKKEDDSFSSSSGESD